MGASITDILAGYAKAQPRRATGGIYALAGFDFQIRLYVARLAESLVAGGEALDAAGNQFVEALSDMAGMDGDTLVCVQAKRTLEPRALRSAAHEIIAIDEYMAQQWPQMRDDVRFDVVGSAGEPGIDWTCLPESPERERIDALVLAGRVMQPRIEPDPWWRAVVAVWNALEDPFDFLRYALDQALKRQPAAADAQRIRDAICERFKRGRRVEPVFGEAPRPADFDPLPAVQPRLDVGKEITLHRVRDRQYMARPERVTALRADVEECFQAARQGNTSAVHVFWLSGRSGVGKSVLLVQLMESLVREGRSVLWLKGAAKELSPVLYTVARQPEEMRPEFIAVDDLYDRDARSLDWAALGAFLDEQGPRPWPLVLTCGPAEFAEDFERDTRYRGFELHRAAIQPVAGDESERVVEWYAERRRVRPKLAKAFEETKQGGGLFVSMAIELEYGDLREFAARFAQRVALQQLETPLCLPLALNRLYLRAPYDWLDREAREHLDRLNADQDFTLLELGDVGRHVRLTHPHLSDAIYRAIRGQTNRLGYAHDLADAFKRCLHENNLPLATQMLRVSSAVREDVLGERLACIDDATLAAACAEAWDGARDGLTLPPEMRADVAVSWACWATTQPVIAERLGFNMLQQAVAALEHAQRNWPICWRRLWFFHPESRSLVEWAKIHLPDSRRMEHQQWSFVWERLFDAAEPGTADAALWRRTALTWLARPDEAPDWHFVWKRLKPQHAEGHDLAHDPVFVSGIQRITSNPEGPEWAFVFQDLLLLAEQLPEQPVAKDLIARGWQWLQGREDRAEWNYVWQALLARPTLMPAGTTERDLVARGWHWLQGREDRAEWKYVWEALLARPALMPAGTTERDLVVLGWRWLQGREDRAEWKYVWEALLVRPTLMPAGTTERDLVARGWHWLQGREDRVQWTHAWEALLARPTLMPAGTTERDLVARGWRWLQGREDRPDWTQVWEALLSRPTLMPAGTTERDLVALGWRWLQGREDRAEWNYVWEALLARPTLMPAGMTERDLVARGWHWLQGREDRAEWKYVWEALLVRPTLMPAGTTERDLVALGWRWLQGREDRAQWNYVWEALLSRPTLMPAGTTERDLVALGWRWLQGHEDRAQWTHAWEALLARPTLMPGGTKERDLVALGWRWLQGREDRAEWAHVWQALLSRPTLMPGGTTERDLVALGWRWFQGREDRAEWSHVWEALLSRPTLMPAGTTERDLVALGWRWLQGREDRPDWSHVWEALLSRPTLMPAGTTERDLVALGLRWLQGREDRPDWTHVWQDMLKRPRFLPDDVSLVDLEDWGWRWLEAYSDNPSWPNVWSCLSRSSSLDQRCWNRLTNKGLEWLRQPGHLHEKAASWLIDRLLEMDSQEPELLRLAGEWLRSHTDTNSGPIIAVKYLAHAPSSPHAERIAAGLIQRIQALPNSAFWLKAGKFLSGLRGLQDKPEAIAALLDAFDNRHMAPPWRRAQEALDARKPLTARITHIKRSAQCSVELELGLLAVMPYSGKRRKVGEQLDVVVDAINPEQGFVRVRAAGEYGHPVATSIPVGVECTGTVTGFQAYGLFVSVDGEPGLIHTSTGSLPDDFRERHPKGSLIAVRVLDTTSRGLVLERVASAAEAQA